MKKKLFAGFLSLLMVLTMATGTFAAVFSSHPAGYYCPENQAPNHSSVSTTMFDECPKCGYALAVFYTDNGSVKYICPDCKESGYAVKTTPDCICGKSCDCRVQCVCGNYVSCGKECARCGKYVSCSAKCTDCKKPSADKDQCGTTCTKDCSCTVQCTSCKGSGECGDVCKTCGKTLTCSADCKTCSRKPSKPSTGVEYLNNVSVTQTSGGTYHLSPAYRTTEGLKKTLSITPNDGFELTNVVINGVSYGGNCYRFDLDATRGYYVKIVFSKIKVNIKYSVTAESEGNGTVVLYKNGTKAANTSTHAVYTDKLSYSFIPAENYEVKDVKVNGKSVGAKTSYYLEHLRGDVAISVEFVWDIPYTDVADAHKAAVEYVTEAGLMSGFYTHIHTDLFKGEKLVSLKTAADVLAEMADTKNALSTKNERIKWMTDNGIIDKDADLTEILTTEGMCELIAKYLEVLEDKNNIAIIGDKSTNTAKETCIALNLVTEKAYKTNAKLTRYALAEFCYAISNLDYVG
ncbi:MAG: hypothetical protein E7638_02685 [Ruminococcaceae bacterium]|nr:hypothetical protein [Oscillospiraceae bacterium]